MASEKPLERIKNVLESLYSSEVAENLFVSLKGLMDFYGTNGIIAGKRARYEDQLILNEKDAFLITYGNTIWNEKEKPLKTLRRFLRGHVTEGISGIHLLPFFPSSSDGGYAIIDYKAVDPLLGSWEDIVQLSSRYRLMVDFVMNHVSSKSAWFEGFLRGDERFRDYFIASDEDRNMPEVFRPRDLSLFTRFDTAAGPKYLWTTFSPDQIDLNYKNPQVLLEAVDTLLFYLTKGAEIVRLDAIGYVWKEPHTSCVNLPQTHQIVRLLRGVLDYAAPYAGILTEANFPDKDNLAYLGKGHQADMVYNFSLPPLVIDAFARGDMTSIMEETNNTPQDVLFFDFLASHDGIGLLSAKTNLKQADFLNLIQLIKDHEGLISYKATERGRAPYELNISYFDAICDPQGPGGPAAVKKFMASQAVMLFLKGIPGIYIHSLLGSRNDHRAVEKTGIKRMINRGRIREKELEKALSDPDSIRCRVLKGFLYLLRERREIPAFHPESEREVIDFVDKRILIIERRFQEETIYALINVTNETVSLAEYNEKFDLLSNGPFKGRIEPYGIYLLK
jgi:glucosylglycerate phosphorylase